MRICIIFCVYILIYSVQCKIAKALTESMGQEVIEISHPLKDLPPDIEEEPSAEVDDDDDEDKPSTTIAPSVATKKEVKTSKASSETATKLLQIQTTDNNIRRKGKDPIEQSQEEEEAKIEKELAEIYKDTEDYKADSSEVGNNSSADKLSLRSKANFKFQPEHVNNAREVERFRTSIDEISCDRSVTKKMSHHTGAAVPTFSNSVIPSAILGLAAIPFMLYTT